MPGISVNLCGNIKYNFEHFYTSTRPKSLSKPTPSYPALSQSLTESNRVKTFISSSISPTLPSLPHSWSQTKAKTQWHRPSCNPLVLGRASQLSEHVSSSAMHWTLSERRLSKHSFTGQLSFGGQSTSIWAGVMIGAESQPKCKKAV